jgi:hypothetical protein
MIDHITRSERAISRGQALLTSVSSKLEYCAGCTLELEDCENGLGCQRCAVCNALPENCPNDHEQLPEAAFPEKDYEGAIEAQVDLDLAHAEEQHLEEALEDMREGR